MNKFEYIFLKNNRVLDVLTFENEDLELLNQILIEKNFDQFILVGENKPSIYSTYENGEFVPPTKDYLLSIGVLVEDSTPSLDNV